MTQAMNLSSVQYAQSLTHEIELEATLGMQGTRSSRFCEAGAPGYDSHVFTCIALVLLDMMEDIPIARSHVYEDY